MTLTKEDLVKLENLMDKRDEKLVGKISNLMDKKMLYFHEQVSEPMVNHVFEVLQTEIASVADNTDRIERKLDNITDHHSERVDNHEKRIFGLERRATVSL